MLAQVSTFDKEPGTCHAVGTLLDVSCLLHAALSQQTGVSQGAGLNVAQVSAFDEEPGSISGSVSMTGLAFQELAPTEQASAAAQVNVFARVEPSHKSLLVTRLKEQVRTTTSLPSFSKLIGGWSHQVAFLS
jgi:magnesium-transporting ATPase (P-type)